MTGTKRPRIPPFTTVEEEAGVITEGAITWSSTAHSVAPGPAELRRMAAIFDRWKRVYGAAAEALRSRALNEEATAVASDGKPATGLASKPKRPAGQEPKKGLRMQKIEGKKMSSRRGSAASIPRSAPTPSPRRLSSAG